MRITNKIMQRNNLSNINTNKLYQDRLSTQMSTEKKINRPSDDPVVAIRALRLRTNVTEITQYYTKNIPDAESWLEVTEDALSNLSGVITKMIEQCTKGSNGTSKSTLKTTDRQIILEQLQKLGDEVYSTGDADYAGRYVFTGYRTDTPLSFGKAGQVKYEITEQLDSSALDVVTHVNTGRLLEINSSNYGTITNAQGNPITEADVSHVDVHRIRLAYDNCSDYAALYDEVTGQQAALKDTLKMYKPYFTPAVVGDFDMSLLDSDNLSPEDVAKIGEAIQKVMDKAGIRTAAAANGINALNDSTSGGGIIGIAPDLKEEENQNFLKNWVTDYEKTQETMAGLASPTIQFTDADGKVNIWTGFAGNAAGASVQAGDTVTETGVITLKHSYEKEPSPYDYAAQNPDAIVYVPETGELLFGENRYAKLVATRDSEATADVNEAEIRVTYQKTSWEKGDLRPEHYFYCKAEKKDISGNTVKDDSGNPVELTYNEDYLTVGHERQVIEYDVGYNQTIQVNSTADECFNHGVGREVDDIMNCMKNVMDLEAVKADIENALKNVDENNQQDKTLLQNQLDAVKRALTYAQDKEQKAFEKGITSFQKYLNQANMSITSCGARGSKLELVKNRTQNQKTTFETLKSENEDIDITEVIIQLTAAEMTYNASLMATGKVAQTTLLNYI